MGDGLAGTHSLKASERPGEAIRESEDFNRSILASLNDSIAIIDRNGAILAVNEAWERFASGEDLPAPAGTGVGTSYLDVCNRAVRTRDDLAEQALKGIRSVLQGRKGAFLLEYPCDPPFENH